MRHLDDGTLMALLDGEIPSDELAPVTAHLEACPECRARRDAARAMTTDTDALIAALGDGAPVSSSSTGATPTVPRRAAATLPLPRILAWAATVLLAAGAGYWLRGTDRPPDPIAVAMDLQAPPEAAAIEPPAAAPAVESTAAPPAPAGMAPAGGAARSATNSARERDTSPPPAELAVETAERRDTALGLAAKAAAPPAQGLAPPPVAGRTVLGRLAAPTAEPAPMALADRAEVAVESFAPIGFAEAIARLGGTIRLIEGLVPDRLEASAATVRVVYPLGTGELLLEQRRIGDSVSVTLRGPVTTDSLAALRRRIR